MNLEAYLSFVGHLATGMIWTVICLALVLVACVYGFKIGSHLIKNADDNIGKLRRAKFFKPRQLAVVRPTPERKQKKAAQ